MTLSVTLEELQGLKKGLHRLIKHKRDNVKNITKRLGNDPEDAEVTTIRKQMIERRERDIKEAQALLDSLDALSVEVK